MTDRDVHQLHDVTDSTHHEETGTDSAHDLEVLLSVGLGALADEFLAVLKVFAGDLKHFIHGKRVEVVSQKPITMGAPHEPRFRRTTGSFCLRNEGPDAI